VLDLFVMAANVGPSEKAVSEIEYFHLVCSSCQVCHLSPFTAPHVLVLAVIRDKDKKIHPLARRFILKDTVRACEVMNNWMNIPLSL